MNREKLAHHLLTLVGLATLLIALTACARTDPEKALRATITEMEAAVKAREPAKLVGYLAQDFSRSGEGGMNRDEARRTVAAVLLTNPNIYMNVSISELTIAGNTATAKLVVVAGGGSGIIPERAQSWNFTTRWRFENDKWLVERADWTELL
ncbi:MAG: nuclear transport factor 2 family protein [Betaproteobacteria bacterium]|nr:MAG: nuclear transport factor 2 family protein [Betaproteobacteria bacterium]